MFIIWSKGLKIKFKNRKWNYLNRKWNYFSPFQASDQKTSYTKCFSFVPRVSKLIFKTGNGIIQTGNGIISPTSRPLMKKYHMSIFSPSSDLPPTPPSEQKWAFVIPFPLWSHDSWTTKLQIGFIPEMTSLIDYNSFSLDSVGSIII